MLHIPNFTHIYSVFIILSLVIPFVIIYIRNRYKFREGILFYSFFVAFTGAIIGGILYHIAAEFIVNRKLSIGLSSYGGALGLIAAIYFYNYFFMKRNSSTLKRILREEYFIHIPLIYSISKLACGFNGCCCGIIYNGPFSVTYDGITSHLPVQFIESAYFFLIYLFAVKLLNKRDDKVELTFALSALIKAMLECLREGYTGININQVVSLIIAMFCVTVMVRRDNNFEKA